MFNFSKDYFMKKILAMLMILFLALSFMCSKPTDEESESNNNNNNNGNKKELVFDNFENNDEDVQNAIGEKLGALKEKEDGKIEFGGGQYYAYASDNGAKVLSSDGDAVVDGDEVSTDDKDKISKLFEDKKFKFKFDCTEVSTNEYWAGIGCTIAGDRKEPLDGYDDEESGLPANEDDEDNIKKVLDESKVYYDFSKIKAIKIKGKLQGPVSIFFETYEIWKACDFDPENTWGYHAYSLKGGESDLEDINETIELNKDNFVQTNSEIDEVDFDDAIKAVCGFTIELDTESDNYAEGEIDEIILVFDDEKEISKTFPFFK
jgi:hypothetical protein